MSRTLCLRREVVQNANSFVEEACFETVCSGKGDFGCWYQDLCVEGGMYGSTAFH